MSIFEDDGAQLNQKSMIRAALAEQGIEIGTAKSGEDQKREERRSYDAALQAVSEYQNRLKQQLLALLDERELIIEQINTMNAQRQRLEVYADLLVAGEVPERNPDGSYKDQELEALILSHEKRIGRSVDRGDPGAILAIIIAEQARLAQNQEDMSQQLEEIKRQIDELKQEIGAERSGLHLITVKNRLCSLPKS